MESQERAGMMIGYEESEHQIRDLLRSLREYIHYMISSGVHEMPFTPGEPVSCDEIASAENKVVHRLEEIRRKMRDCTRCKLSHYRTNIVFGEGNPSADLVFIGEAPGEEEDRQGRPFVGRAGQLLTKIIGAMGLERQDVYICNILKCRPPQNRNPKQEEMETCEPFLIKQIEAIRPKVICALGTFAARRILQTDVPITVLRGKFHEFRGVRVMPTYHPAYLLRNPDAKKQVWEDIQLIMKVL